MRLASEAMQLVVVAATLPSPITKHLRNSQRMEGVACVAIWLKVLHIIWHMRWGDTQPCPITKLSRAASTTPVETL